LNIVNKHYRNHEDKAMSGQVVNWTRTRRGLEIDRFTYLLTF
jgi:hypothetical protein